MRSRHSRPFGLLATAGLVFGLLAGAAGNAPPVAAAGPISFTILHTNDVHGQLQASGSNPGLARVATIVQGIRDSAGAANVLLVDGGDEMQGSLLSNLQKGAPAIGTFDAIKYDVATFGNHEFDWGQSVLSDRTKQAQYPFVTANIVKNDTGSCSTAGWTKPDFASAPYVVKTVAGVKVAFIGVTTQETPTITIASSTAGICFKDPAESIEHYYSSMKSDADVIVVLSHLGFTDGGYGYGLPVYGDQTLADKLVKAGTPVPLIIGGHSHTNVTVPAPVIDDVTTVVQAYYNGRQVGDANLTFDPSTKAVTVSWKKLTVVPPGAKDANGAAIPETPENAAIKSVIDGYAADPAYMSLVNQPIGYSAVDLGRNQVETSPGQFSTRSDNMMGTFVDDAIYNYLNTDGNPANDVDLFLNNAGGIRTDWCYNGTAWVNTGCAKGTHAPALLTYGNMFTILPFGNATVVGEMTGAQILQVLNQAPQVSNGVIQPAGLKFKYYAYRDSNPGPQPFAWGAFDYCVMNKTTHNCDSLQMDKTYKVGTNEFLAPAGGDGYGGFKYMTHVTYWGDMLNAVDAYVSKHYGTAATAYKGPNGDGKLDGRITRDGTDAPNSGSVIPITILHNNDSHGNLTKGQYVGMTQLATLIKQEELHNPGRTILLNGGDQIQGDAMSYYFKSAPSGFAADGSALPKELQTDPIIAVMNALGYTAMTLGNHEFNFGKDVFDGIFKQAQFPLLGANVSDSGAYGMKTVGPQGKGVQPYLELNLKGVKVAVLGITNHRVPNYELPSNIVGLTFGNPITAGKTYAPALKSRDDVLVALTHIGFTTNPKSVEVDNNVDTNFAAAVPGVDAIVGSHSHTNPASPEAPYKFLPTIVGGPNNSPVLISQAYRYNNTLGEEVLGVRSKVQLTIEDVGRLYSLKSINSAVTRNALLSALTHIKSQFAQGHISAATKELKALIASVKAQTGLHITKAAATTLIADANWMITHKGGYQVVARAGQYLTVKMDTAEDPATVALLKPYVDFLATYNNKVVGKTTAPIDTTNAFTDETNGANLQADAAVWELAQHGITDVDVHLSGAMTNKLMAEGATSASPVTLKISDMFGGMPYENSLVVLKMNGPQLKAVLERAYRNYYYYKYVPDFGGYSHYTTCLLDTNALGKITYTEKTPGTYDPKKAYVASFEINGKAVDFTDATKSYNVSTVNYLAAGSCNFNDNGVSLWPLKQIAHDTQFYVRDAVIDYITAKGTVSPAIEGRIAYLK